MPILRIVKHEKPYVQIDKSALNDARLSFRAKGLYAYLMSKPNDWNINMKHLENMSPKEGREAIRGAMKELRECGYSKRQPIQNLKTGRMAGWETVMYETPKLASLAIEDEKLSSPSDGFPSVDKPSVDKLTDGKPSSTNKKAFTQNRAVRTNEKEDPPLAPPVNGGGGNTPGETTRAKKRRRGETVRTHGPTHQGLDSWQAKREIKETPCTLETLKSLQP
jgi:hypothetical protein